MELKNWSKKQLAEYELLDRVDEDKIRESFTSKTHECDLRIIGIYWSSFGDEKVICVTAVGEMNGEMQKFKFKVMNPIMPRVKSLEEMLDGRISAMCHYGQYSAVAAHRKVLMCYCKIEKTDGKKFNLSTASLTKDLGDFVESLPSRRFVKSKDFKNFNDLPIRDLRDL